jgi:large subunit ribosomal protein L29
MKTTQIREMAAEERTQKLQELREELFQLRFQAASGQLEKPHRIKQVRKEIARLLTITKEEKQ